MGIRILLAENPRKRRIYTFWKRIATPVCGLARNDSFSSSKKRRCERTGAFIRFSQKKNSLIWPYRIRIMHSGVMNFTQILKKP